MFEQELYHSFSISSSRSYFISFAGDVSVCTHVWRARVAPVLEQNLRSRTSGSDGGCAPSRPARWA